MSNTTGPLRSDSEPPPEEPPPRPRGGTGWIAAFRARLGLSGQTNVRTTLEDALRREAQTADAFSAVERDMMLRLLRFGSLRVDDIMVPRADIIALDEQLSLAELVRTFREAGVSRIPVFRETLDDPRGMVHVKDLMRFLALDTLPTNAGPPATTSDLSRTIASAKILRPVLYVPPSMPAVNLLIRMQSTRNHMALVVDEYGGTDGLATIEDLVEQVVGEIEDEHDVAEAANIRDDGKQGLVTAARTPIGELEARLAIKLLKPEEEASIDTVGGLVSALVGRVPIRGELVRHPSGVEFEVLDADPRRVKIIKVHPPKVAGSPVPTPPL